MFNNFEYMFKANLSNKQNPDLINTSQGRISHAVAFVVGRLVLLRDIYHPMQYWTCTEGHADKTRKNKSAEQAVLNKLNLID